MKIISAHSDLVENPALSIDPNMKQILKFQTSADMDNFLSMPLFKKLTVSEIENLPLALEPVLNRKVFDSSLVDLDQHLSMPIKKYTE